jgi:hypothetical protein
MELLQNFYETTLDALKEAKNERLWFKTNTKLGKLYFDRGDYQKLQKILKQLHQSCQVTKQPVDHDSKQLLDNDLTQGFSSERCGPLGTHPIGGLGSPQTSGRLKSSSFSFQKPGMYEHS